VDVQPAGKVGSQPPSEHVVERKDAPGKVDFLTLLAAQLRYQSPLEPMSERDMVVQLAQFSMLEELEKIRTSQEGQATSAEGLGERLMTMTAVNLLGREVSAVMRDDDGSDRTITGKVTAARWDSEDGAEVLVGDRWVPWHALTGARVGGHDDDR